VLVERRVVLLSRDPGLISITGRLLSNGDRIAHFRSVAEVSDWSTPVVAAVVLDSPPQTRRLSYKQVRDRYDGPLVMLLDTGERRPDLPPDGARRFLHRPFRVAELSRLLGSPGPGLGQFEAAIIAAWSRHATAEQAVRARRGPSYRINWRPSLRRRVRAWAATVVALMGLLLVFGLSDQGSCAPACTTFGGPVAGASESGTPLTAPAGGSGGSGGGRPPGSSGASSQPPTPAGGGLPVVAGVGGLIDSISPITSDDTTPPTGPQAVPGVPAAPGADPPPATSPPPTTTPPGTDPPATTAPPTTAPPTTDPPATTAPPTTAPPTTEPPTTQPPTTEPPTTAPPTTAPPTTEPPTTEPPTTEPPTTAAPTTEAPTTEAPTTAANPTP
jgi:hypothetical protein